MKEFRNFWIKLREDKHFTITAGEDYLYNSLYAWIEKHSEYQGGIKDAIEETDNCISEYEKVFNMEKDSRYKTIGGETCLNCGKKHVICWKAPDDLWVKLFGERGTRICVECFDSIAAANGYALAWECKPHPIYKGVNDNGVANNLRRNKKEI